VNARSPKRIVPAHLVSARVPERKAMKITGHKTEAVYRRYAIVSDADLQEATRRLAAAGTFPGTLATAAVDGRPPNP
jgi:hypothetical protein